MKIKGQTNPRPAYAGLMHAYVGMDLHTHLGFQKPMKDKFFALMLRFGTNLTLSGSRSKPLFFSIYKGIRDTFSKHTENPKGKPKIH